MGTTELDIEAMVGRARGGGEERILSIVLSTSELAKLDLSNIQLFQANEAQIHGQNEGIFMNSEANHLPLFKSRAVMEAESTRRRPLPLPSISRNKNNTAMPLPEPQQKPRIDLKSSPASKFLAQIMPWELQPSPVTPFMPAAVPFEWEEAPGKPKPSVPDRRSPRPLLHLPPRLLPRKGLNSKSVADCQSSGSAEEKRSISIEGVHKNPGCVLSSADCKNPNSENRTFAFITMWRKKYSSKQNRNGSDKSRNQKSLNPGGEFLIQEEEQKLWVFEEGKSKEAQKNCQSLNGMIAAAMGAQTEDLDLCQSRRDPYLENFKSSPAMNSQFCCPKMPRRTKRKWVLRKIRRPARFFFGDLFGSEDRGTAALETQNSPTNPLGVEDCEPDLAMALA